jgi:hypothetical protein
MFDKPPLNGVVDSRSVGHFTAVLIATIISIFFSFLLLCFLVTDYNENDLLIKGI